MNTTHLKWLFAAVLLLAALVAGLYLSGWITVMLLDMHGRVEVGPKTWLAYLQQIDTPRGARFAGKIKAGGAIGFGVPLLAWALLLVPLARSGPRTSTHGDARFATKAELAKGGMLQPAGNGIVVGKMGGDLIRLGGTRHALLSAPTRSGKGVGAVIPNLLTFEESLMVLDIKQEAFDLTSGWRARYGPVYLFNPFAEDLRTHRWNPLTYVSRDPKFRITDLQAIAAILYEEDPQRDSFWTNQARNCFLAASLYLCETDDRDLADGLPDEFRHIPSLGRIYRLFSGDGSELKAYLQKLASQKYLSKDCKTAFANLTALADQTFTSVIGSFQEPLHIFLNPILDAATSGDDFNLRNLRREKMTVYVGITPNKLAEARKLLNLFFSQAININTQQLPEKDPSLKYQCLLLLDEFTSIGRVDIIAHAISYLAGYNMRVFCVIQSLSQLDATYGPEVARTMVTNMACQVVYTPREQRDANEYSEMLGYTTLRRRSRTRSHGQHGSVSYAEVEERRALMLPQELKALSPEVEIIFVEGIAHPIKCSKIRYYKDAFFKQRLKEKAPVNTLKLGGEPKQEDNDVKPSTTLMTAAVMTALAACANPADGVAQTPQTQPPAERSAQAEKDDPDMAAAKQAADEAAAAAQAAADTMQAAMDAGHVAEPPPAYVPPTQARLQAIPARMSTAQLRERIIALISGLQQPGDLEKPAVERVLGVRLQRVPGAEDAWPNRPQHHAEIAIDDTWVATVTVIDGKDDEFGTVNITTSNVWRDPECRILLEDLVNPLSEKGFEAASMAAPLPPFTIISKENAGIPHPFGATIYEIRLQDPDGKQINCIEQIQISGGKES